MTPVYRTKKQQLQPRAKSAGVAQPVLPSGDAPETEDGESGDGAPTGNSFVLDVARGTGLRAAEEFGSHAGQPGTGDGVHENSE
jgi:hypothetical protein